MRICRKERIALPVILAVILIAIFLAVFLRSYLPFGFLKQAKQPEIFTQAPGQLFDDNFNTSSLTQWQVIAEGNNSITSGVNFDNKRVLKIHYQTASSAPILLYIYLVLPNKASSRSVFMTMGPAGAVRAFPWPTPTTARQSLLAFIQITPILISAGLARTSLGTSLIQKLGVPKVGTPSK